MSLVLADRVKETTTTIGTGTYSLAGAAIGFQGFVTGIGTTNQCFYCAEDGTNWEVGVGTVTDASPDTLSRDIILASSNAGTAVNWAAGIKDIFVTDPALRIQNSNLRAISTAASITAKAGEFILVDASGGNRTITLPNTPPIETRVGIYFQTGSGSNTVTLARQAGQTIDGASTDEVLYITGDYCELMAVSTTAWIAIQKKYTSHHAKLTSSAVQSGIVTATFTKCTLDTKEIDIGSIGDVVTNDRINIRRSGRYYVQATVSIDVLADTAQLIPCIYKNGSIVSVTQIATGGTTNVVLRVTDQLDLVATDYLEAFIYHTHGSNRSTLATIDMRPSIQALEIR